jgi:hypothetical protein
VVVVGIGAEIRGLGSGKSRSRSVNCPHVRLALTPTAEPLVPGPLQLLDDPQQRNQVAADTEVVEVTLDSSLERFVLNRDRLVPMATTPIVDGSNEPSQSRTACLARHCPTPLTSSRPVEREPEEVEGRPAFPALSRFGARRNGGRRDIASPSSVRPSPPIQSISRAWPHSISHPPGHQGVGESRKTGSAVLSLTRSKCNSTA